MLPSDGATRVELVVFATQGEQFVVGAVLNDAAVVEDDNLVGIAHGGEAVGNDKGFRVYGDKVTK